MKRLLLVGSVGCGKTTLLQRLHDRELEYSKTQTISVDETIVDTPGEYLELPYFKHALRLASYEVDLVVMLAAATVEEATYPPGFTTFFMPPAIGAVTKTDIASAAQVQLATSRLREAGVTEIFPVSAVTGEGIAALATRLA